MVSFIALLWWASASSPFCVCICTAYISLHDCWHRPVSLFALLCFKPFHDSLSKLCLPQQDNPAVSHKMAASVIYNNLQELAEEQSTGGNCRSGEPCSQCDSQLEGVLSPHVKRLLARWPPSSRGLGRAAGLGSRDRQYCVTLPEQEVEVKALFLLHRAQHDSSWSEAKLSPRGHRSLAWPHCLTVF